MSDKILSPDEFRDLRADDPKAADAAYEVLRKRVTELEAGLRELDAEVETLRFSSNSMDYIHFVAALNDRIRALLGGVPATKEEQTCEECNGTGDAVREVTSPVGGDPYETRVGDCPACDGTGVLGGVPAAAPAPAAWAPEIQEWAIINRALTASEQDRVYELARSGTPIADALRTVAQEGDTVTEGEVEKTE